MTSQTLVIQNRIGLHARPASMLINDAKRFSARVTLQKGGEAIDLNSLVSLMRLRVQMGDEIILCADGEDEQAAIESLRSLIQSKFGED